MDSLPNEIILEIFNYILKITDKRQFLRTCLNYNILTKQLFIDYETNYKIKEFENYKIKTLVHYEIETVKNLINYCVEKFTLELCYDKYFDMIPKSYINKNNKMIVSALASFNCINLLELALDNGCKAYTPFGTSYQDDANSICEFASLNGHIEIIDFAITKYGKSVFKNPYICAGAALYGHLETLKLLREKGFNIDPNSCIYAAIGGQLEVLQWLLNNDYKWTNKIYRYAKNYNHKEMLEWIEENGYVK